MKKQKVIITAAVVTSGRGRLVFILFFGFMCLCGCVSTEKKASVQAIFGKEFNAERLRLSIPLIEKEWEIVSSDTTQLTWKNTTRLPLMNTPEHIAKIIKIKGLRILSEEDVFNFMDDKIAYRIFLEYNYGSGTLSRVDFLIHRFQTYSPSNWKPVSHEFADSVLRRWKIFDLYHGLTKAK